MVHYPLICEMNIKGCVAGFWQINIDSENRNAEILFSSELKELKYISDNVFTDTLKDNEYQLRKILHNKRKDTFYIGFKLNFILNKYIDAISFNDIENLIVYDRREKEVQVSVKEKYKPDFITLYTDGAYSEKKEICSYVSLFKSVKGLYSVKFGIKNLQNSSLIEMIAVIEGLKVLKDETKVRIVTDSRYVIKA